MRLRGWNLHFQRINELGGCWPTLLSLLGQGLLQHDELCLCHEGARRHGHRIALMLHQDGSS